jgi:putative ABC transport system permease protein
MPTVRALRRSPGFSVAAILTLALGIGLSTAVFTVADAVLLRRLPVRDQDRVLLIWGELPKRGFDHYPLTVDDARDFARRTRALERVGFVGYEGAWPVSTRDGDRVSRLRRAIVSGEFFGVLGAQPVLGRALRASDDVNGAAPVAVLSYGAWQRRFGGDPHVLGRPLFIIEKGLPFTIVGVMPQGLDYPRGSDFWVTLNSWIPPQALQYASLDAVGRLALGRTAATVGDELTAFYRRPEASVRQRDVHAVVSTLPRVLLGDTRVALLVFATAAGLLLLMTCVNVANLLLVRGLTRAREVAVRSALGASRGRVVRQLLGENALLALIGGAMGVAVAAMAVQTFIAFAPADLPRLDEIRLNLGALTSAAGITMLAMILFGIVPAITTSRTDVQEVLRSGARQSVTRRSRLATEALVTVQVALALLILSSAALIGRSLVALERVQLAFDPSHLLIGELALRYDEYDTREKQQALLERLMPALEAIPGVRSVSPVVAVPFSGPGGWDGQLAKDGQTAREAATNPMLNLEVVSSNYFATLGIAMLRGRGFTDADHEGTLPVAVVSQSAARSYWPNEDPIGKHLRIDPKLSRTVTVVGVVPDTRYRDLREARPSIYFPLAQPSFPFVPMTLAIRTAGRPTDVVSTIRRVIAQTSSGAALASAEPFATYVDQPLAQPRLDTILLAVFAASALALAAIGLFGVMMTMVRQRTRELGVRMALGAAPRDLQRMILRRGLSITGIGIAIGLTGALVANRVLTTLLYGVTPTDGLTLGVVVAVLAAVATAASLVPARSTTRIDPAIALRAEG